MSIDKTLWEYMKKGSVGAIFIVVILLLFDYYKVIDLSKIPHIPVPLILWIYLLINVGIATPLNYFNNNPTKNYTRKKTAVSKK